MGEHAPSQLILYHYPNLKEEKGVVLMTAEIDPKFIVSPPPAEVYLHALTAAGYTLINAAYWCFYRVFMTVYR